MVVFHHYFIGMIVPVLSFLINTMEHPNSKCRIVQAEYLSRLPEEERENKARDIRIGNASYIYNQQAVPIQENR